MPPPATTRDRLLAAGRTVILTAGYGLLDGGLTIEALAAEAGVRPQTFHNVFRGGKTKFLDELMASIVVDSPRATQQLLGARIMESLVENNGDPRLAIREVCAWDYDRVRTDDATLIRFFLASLGRTNPAAMKAVRDEYRQITEYGRAAYENTLAHWGAALRTPFTPDSVAVLFTAVLEGLVLRETLDPGAVPEGLFGDAILALTSAVVDLDQQHAHLDDLIEPLADQVVRDFKLITVDDLPENPRKAVIDAARREFAARGFHATSLSRIATVARVDLSHVRKMFASKAYVVLGALKPVYEQIKASTDDDMKIGIGGRDAVSRFIKRLAESAVAEKPMFEALMAAISDTATRDLKSPDHIKNEINFPAVIAPAIRAGQLAGVFSTAVDGGEIAVTITNFVLMRTFTNPKETARDIAASVGLLLDGVVSR